MSGKIPQKPRYNRLNSNFVAPQGCQRFLTPKPSMDLILRSLPNGYKKQLHSKNWNSRIRTYVLTFQVKERPAGQLTLQPLSHFPIFKKVLIGNRTQPHLHYLRFATLFHNQRIPFVFKGALEFRHQNVCKDLFKNWHIVNKFTMKKETI